MRLRAGQGEITDMSAAGSRLTRLQPTYIDAVAQRSFVEPPQAPEGPPAPPRIGGSGMVFFVSLVAVIGPTSRTFSRVV